MPNTFGDLLRKIVPHAAMLGDGGGGRLALGWCYWWFPLVWAGRGWGGVGVDWVDDTMPRWKGAPWTVGLNGKNGKQQCWVLRSVDRSHGESAWLFQTAGRCGGAVGGQPLPTGGGDVVIVSGIPNPGLPGKAPPELKQCLSGWVLDAAALATEIKPGTRGFLQDLTRGAGGVSVLVLRPALQTLVSLQRASWLLSSQLV